MKGLFARCLIFFVCWLGVLPSIAAAGRERSKHISTEEILEFSLLNLKESLQKVKQKNGRLAFENAAFRDDIQYFQGVLQRLITKKAGLLGESPSFDDQKNQSQFMETVYLKGREQRTKDLIAVFGQDVSELKKEIQFLEDHLDQKQFDSEKRLLLKRKQKGLKNVSKLEKNLKVLVNRNRAPEKTIETLKNEKRVLEVKIAKLEVGPNRY